MAAVQVILAAIAKSDGTRKGVTDAGLQRHAASRSRPTSRCIGKEIKIDPETGDVNAKDITIELMKGNAETFVKAQSGQLTESDGPGGEPLPGPDADVAATARCTSALSPSPPR